MSSGPRMIYQITTAFTITHQGRSESLTIPTHDCNLIKLKHPKLIFKFVQMAGHHSMSNDPIKNSSISEHRNMSWGSTWSPSQIQQTFEDKPQVLTFITDNNVVFSVLWIEGFPLEYTLKTYPIDFNAILRVHFDCKQ